MQPFADPAGLSAGQDTPQRPPSLGSSGYSGQAYSGKAAGTACAPHARDARDLNTQAGLDLKRPGPRANSPMRSELAQLMEEPAGGANGGRRASTNPEVEGRHLPLAPDDWQASEFMRSGGWSVVHSKDGTRAGVNAHRGVLQADEHVDAEAIRPMVERGLGFSYEQVRSVYRQGRLSATQRELRGQIDARLLALSLEGGNMAQLGRLLGFEVDEDEGCQTIKRACRRARAAESTTDIEEARNGLD